MKGLTLCGTIAAIFLSFSPAFADSNSDDRMRHFQDMRRFASLIGVNDAGDNIAMFDQVYSRVKTLFDNGTEPEADDIHGMLVGRSIEAIPQTHSMSFSNALLVGEEIEKDHRFWQRGEKEFRVWPAVFGWQPADYFDHLNGMILESAREQNSDDWNFSRPAWDHGQVAVERTKGGSVQRHLIRLSGRWVVMKTTSDGSSPETYAVFYLKAVPRHKEAPLPPAILNRGIAAMASAIPGLR